MLDYKKDRLDYGKLLNPPEGFVMERAIATTYSLDLAAFLSVPVALFYNKNMDAKVSEDRMDIFDAIQKTSDTITIYCQQGKMLVPATTNRLYSFVEESVKELLPDEKYKSFHPKLWVVRYKNSEKIILYRFIVLSRNLTFDRSWDVAFYMEGFVSKTVNEKVRPLVDYIRYLRKSKDFQNSDLFIDDLSKTDFNISAPFNDYEFYPMGFEQYANPLLTEKWQDLIIISPFIDKTALNTFINNSSGKKYLFSRKEELDKIHLDILENFNVFAFSPIIVDGEYNENVQEEADEIPLQQNLHAKIYIGTDISGQTKWYLGSANCSFPAMHKNEEFLIGLNSIDRVTSATNILNELLATDKTYKVFEKYSRESRSPVQMDEYDFRSATYELLSFLSQPGNIQASCTLNETEPTKYDLIFEFKPDILFHSDQIEISFSPFGWKGDLMLIHDELSFRFEGLAIYHLSPFVVWQIRHVGKDEEKEFMTRIEINLPTNRRQEIFRSIIKDKERFIQLIQFLLGGSIGAEFFSVRNINEGKSGDSTSKEWFANSHMFEELLLASSRDQNKLKEIEKLLERLRSNGAADLIPDDFLKVWDVFNQVIYHG